MIARKLGKLIFIATDPQADRGHCRLPRSQFNVPVRPRERAACSDARDWLSAVRQVDPRLAA